MGSANNTNPPNPGNNAASAPNSGAGPASGKSAGPNPNRRTPGGIPLAQDSNPYDPRNFDSGGFGYGGTSGSAGGFGVGGNGPQTGAYGSQANFGQGFEAGGPDTWAEDFERHNDWRDTLPQNFHGWGPQTPDPGRTLQRRRPVGRVHPFDHNYLAWRDEQIRKLDAEYLAWRAERQGQFNQNFEEWRRRRNDASQHTATDEPRDAAPRPASDGGRKDGGKN